MNKVNITNVSLDLDCKVVSSPELISSYPTESIYRVIVEVKRLSGVVDKFLLNYSTKSNIQLYEGNFINVKGEIRTLNKSNSAFVKEGFILAKEIILLEQEPENYTNKVVVSNAFINEIKEFRKSFQNNDVDVITMKVKLSRAHSRHSYFTTTAWGKNAIDLNSLSVDDSFDFEGRLQEYVSKRTNRLYLCIAIYKININKEVS